MILRDQFRYLRHSIIFSKMPQGSDRRPNGVAV